VGAVARARRDSSARRGELSLRLFSWAAGDSSVRALRPLLGRGRRHALGDRGIPCGNEPLLLLLSVAEHAEVVLQPCPEGAQFHDGSLRPTVHAGKRRERSFDCPDLPHFAAKGPRVSGFGRCCLTTSRCRLSQRVFVPVFDRHIAEELPPAVAGGDCEGPVTVPSCCGRVRPGRPTRSGSSCRSS
jgi:hypothetical protein